MNKPKLLVIAHTNLGSSLSGGDRIFINLIKYWQRHFDINFLCSVEAQKLIQHHKFNIKISPTYTSQPKPIKLNTLNIFWHHCQRFVTGISYCLSNKSTFKHAEYIYTSSDFYGDYVFGLIAKIINPQIIWLCGYYLLAPNPFDKNSPYLKNHQFFRGLIYYLAQIPTVYIARKFADFVFVTSAPDINVFQNSRLNKSNILIIQGGVYIPSSSIIKKIISPNHRQYDGLYIGRLHSQKGIVELIDIWQIVVTKRPDAKLAIIGDGELFNTIISKINKLKLTNNIELIGFAVGHKKFDIIKNSKIILHPATHDSGGMAAAEAMAWGLPGVSFDLPALKSYYPKGMVKTPCFNNQLFANNILELLTNQNIYLKYSTEARSLTISSWNWKKRLATIYENIIPTTNS